MKLQIIKNTKVWLTISGILFAASFIGFFVWGLKLGIDFTGGSLLELQFAPGQTIDKTAMVTLIKDTETTVNRSIEEYLANPPADTETDEFAPPAQVQSFGEPVIIPITGGISVKLKALDQYSHQKIKDAIESSFPGTIETKFTTIGPTVGESLKQKAIVALIITWIGMIAFIAFAFRKVPRKVSSWKFGVTAVIALFHDVIIPVGVFVLLGQLFNVEVESFFVTALLTIMGFSIHDTIVVFDRIRENMIYQKRDESFADVAEKAIHQTIARSINTSLTTFVTLLFVFLFGSEAIRWFVFTMMIGLLIGTYSSIFIASPLVVLWKQKGVR